MLFNCYDEMMYEEGGKGEFVAMATKLNSKMTQSEVMLALYNEMKGIRDDYDACTRLCKDFSSMVYLVKRRNYQI